MIFHSIPKFAVAAIGAVALTAAAAVQTRAHHPEGQSIDIDARLSQRILKQGATSRVYLRIGIKGRTNDHEAERNPVNIALVIDRSGSMSGDKIVKARDAAMMAIDRLSNRDTASVVIFDNKIETLVSARHVRDHAYFKDRIVEIQPRGSTAIYAAVETAADELRKYKSTDRLNRIILLSDGLANVGPKHPGDFARLGRRLGSEGISVTTIGLGARYNEDLMAQLAANSDGNHAYARSGADLRRIFNGEFSDLLSVAAQDIEVLIETRNGVRPLRTLGRDGQITGNQARIRLNQAYGTSEYSLQLELEVPAEMAQGEFGLARITVNYIGAGGAPHSLEADVTSRFSSSDDEARASIDPKVMEPIIELQARERSKLAVELRDKGRIDDARKLLRKNAEALDQEQAAYRIKSDRLQDLAKKSRAAADAIADTSQWNSTRKQFRMDQNNSYGGARQKF